MGAGAGAPAPPNRAFLKLIPADPPDAGRLRPVPAVPGRPTLPNDDSERTVVGVAAASGPVLQSSFMEGAASGGAPSLTADAAQAAVSIPSTPALSSSSSCVRASRFSR